MSFRQEQEGAEPSAMLSQPLIRLRAGELQVVVAPQAGGSIASFTRRWRQSGGVTEVHWLRPATAAGLVEGNPLDMGSFPLVPFCNRIREGRASFEGREIRFPPNHPSVEAPHPLHGIGWLRPWEVAAATERSTVLTLQVEADEAWPWRFSSRQEITLDEQGLHCTISITNEDTSAMPAGIGHHPYYPHYPGTRVTTEARAMWTGDAEVMPVKLASGGPVAALREGVELASLHLDNNFVGWERRARIEWAADWRGQARSLDMVAESPLDFFVLYSPRGYDHFCAEPVSQCTDWLNLADRHPHEDLGGARVEPGQTLSGRFSLLPRWE